MKYPLLVALATAALAAGALPVTAQTTPAPAPVPTGVSSPAPIGAPAGSPPAPSLTPPPLMTPPPLPTVAPSVTPAPSPTGKGKKGKAAPAPTPTEPVETPSPPAFASLDGDWEFVESSLNDDVYSRLILKQQGQSLTGKWKQSKSKIYPVTGEYENSSGKAGIKLTATIDGKEWTMTGYVDNASDMVGILRDPAGKQVVFTASHRAATKQELLIKP